MAFGFDNIWSGDYCSQIMKSQTFPISEIHVKQLEEIVSIIKNGGIGVIPTDTIYGIVGLAANAKTVEKIYKLRKRTSSKPMIILIESEKQIADLGVRLSDPEIETLSQVWPNPISVVVEAAEPKLQYLHRGKKSLAFRMPDNKFLLKLLKLTGPIVAPSANFEGEEPAKTITEAKEYFKEIVEFYIDAGELKSKPSTIAKLEEAKLTILRAGAVEIPAKFLK